MTSINDSLSPDLLFNTFKRLDCIQTTRIRRVCKQWLEIIDEHKSFWKTLHLPEDSFKKWDPSIVNILQLFDQKSGSTLQDVKVDTEVKGSVLKEVFNILQKSKETLRHLHFVSDFVCHTRQEDLLSMFVKVESLMVLNRFKFERVLQLRRNLNSDGPDTANPLKVLWYHGGGDSILDINSARFVNLVSLDSGSFLSSSEWRTFLEGPSRNLKHLKIQFVDMLAGYHRGISKLEIPNLEVLELVNGGDFPRWLLVPDSMKLITSAVLYNLPSVSELWAWDPRHHKDDIINRLPKLKTLSLIAVCRPEELLRILNERKSNVEAGLEVDGVKMEMIKTLIVPDDISNLDHDKKFKQLLDRCKDLVEVMKGKSRDEFIEVEI